MLLHGWPQHWYQWRDVIPLLAPHARVICPDLRGFGWTDVPERGYEKDQLKRDVLALLDALGHERVTIAGHDWGGFVGFLLALEHPDRIESFLALNVLPPWPPDDQAHDARRVALPLHARARHARPGRWAGRARLRRSRPSRRGLWRQPRSRPSSAGSAASAAARPSGCIAASSGASCRCSLRGRYSASDLSVPSTLLFGTDDLVLTTRAAEDAAAQTDRLELELVDDAGHFVVDEKPELVADRLLRLLP